ncbi:9542_t:CDS:2 [Cetraspora pellucida]|uniref:chitin deacetylase n=1 Tax=Cetraspora pellucida TaxID=1433469 RepID=A0A9N9AQP3_9GLOM|nr:9542_t:CDS:2 [Cetraspora pellucida]
MVSISFIILGSLITTVLAQQQCVPYETTFNYSSYPTVWAVPSSNDTFNTAEFKQLNSSLDWSKVPKIAPRKLVNGSLDLANYSTSDPDCWWSYNLCTKPKATGLQADVSICPEPGTWGLTYDDGPNCSHTVFYDFLKGNNQKATMFFVGSNVANWPNEAQRALADGHHICVHTWSHQYMTTLTNEQALAELYYTKKIIKYVMGVTPLCWRPPFGDVDDRIRGIAQLLNLTTILWNLDTNDWNMVPAGTEQPAQIDALFQSFVDMGQNGTFATSGAIVLEHELNNGTMSKAVEWYPKIKSAYKYVVPIASCLNITHPYAETNITYPSFAEYINVPNNSSSVAKVPSPTNSNTQTDSPKPTTKSASVTIASYNSLISMMIAILTAQLFGSFF